MKSLKRILVFVCTLIISMVLLYVTNIFTAPRIEANYSALANKALISVLPDGKNFSEVLNITNAPDTVKNVYEETNGAGYVIKLSTRSSYSTDDLLFTLGIGADGKIKGVDITSYNETKNFGEEYPLTYIGADSALNDVDTFAGATFSSTAFKNAVGDAFTYLVSNGMVEEGKKSVDTIINELLPSIFPGACDYIGNAQISEIDNNNFTKVYAANNNAGYVVVTEEGEDTFISVINAFDVVKTYDLTGKEVATAENVKGILPVLSNDSEDANSSQVLKTVSEDSSIEAIEGITSFDTVTGAFLVTSAGGEYYYAFNVVPFGYANELMEMVVVIDANGNIVNYRTVSDLILHEEYYDSHGLKDKDAYKNQFIGLSEDTFSDDLTLVSGATFTGNAVSNSIRSAFNAFMSLQEVE